MKRLYKYLGLGALGLALSVPLLGTAPVQASLQEMGEAIAQVINRPKMELSLSAYKKMVKADAEGKEVVSYEDLGSQAVVNPGDTLRYELAGKNDGDIAAKNLVLNQAIPEGMSYLLGSATSDNKVNITYQLKEGYKRPEGSQEFEAEPKILVEVAQADGSVVEEIQAAPADAYAQVRWEFSSDLTPKEDINVSYEVLVK